MRFLIEIEKRSEYIQMFCFYFKYKTAALLMAALNLTLGILGTITFAVILKVHRKCSFHEVNICEDYLIFSIFHVLCSIPLLSAIIWELPVFILMYEVLHVSTSVTFLTHTIIFWPIERFFYILCIYFCFTTYCMYCVYLFYRQMILKRKSNLGIVHFTGTVYFRNENTL